MDYEYRRALVTFIDVLGFEQLVSSSPPDFIGTLLADLKEMSSRYGEGSAMALSDSIIRVRYVDTEDKIGAIFHELQSLLVVQTAALENHVLIRGGMTIGNIYFEPGGQMIFGPALNRAYEIESRIAKYPRIVVGEEVFASHPIEPALQGRAHGLDEDRTFLSNFLTELNDNHCFLDYLGTPVLGSGDAFAWALLSHFNIIMGSLQNKTISEGVREKYVWLAKYHNSVIRRKFPASDEHACFVKHELLNSP